LRAVEEGFPQKEISESAYQFQLEVDAREQTIVGVNKYQEGGEQDIPTLKIDQAAERNQIEKIKAFRDRRDDAKWKDAMVKIELA